MQTTTYSLGKLLDRVSQGNLTIPRFQRKFEWKESQVRSLVDSISRAYPIGSVLILDKKPDLPLATRDIDAVIREDDLPEAPSSVADAGRSADEPQSEIESYILDGQQRTTSIARVFLNSHPTKVYYFDLKSILELYDEEDISWIRTRYRRKTNNPDRRENNRLLRADVCLDQRKSDIYVSEYIEDSGEFPLFESNRKAGREASAKIKGIFETIRSYKIPVVSLDPDHGLDSICRVFETINSTGTRLKTFDLAVARFYPNPDLRQLWEDAVEEHKILKDFDANGERALQIICLAESARKDGYPETSRGALLGLAKETISREWQQAVNALAKTYRWANLRGARPETLPNHNVLVAISAVLHVRTSKQLDNSWLESEFLRRWYYSKVLQAGSSQASNYRIGQDYSALLKYAMNGERPQVAEVALDAELVQRLKPHDARYKALQCIFAHTIRSDLISDEMIREESKLHDHHIFPRSSLKKHGLPRVLLDGLCNRAYILDTSNLKISDEQPAVYMKRLADRHRIEGTLGAFQRRLSNYMIPGDPTRDSWEAVFAVENFEAFCKARADLIMQRVREVVGESLKTSLSDDEMADIDV